MPLLWPTRSSSYATFTTATDCYLWHISGVMLICWTQVYMFVDHMCHWDASQDVDLESSPAFQCLGSTFSAVIDWGQGNITARLQRLFMHCIWAALYSIHIPCTQSLVVRQAVLTWYPARPMVSWENIDLWGQGSSRALISIWIYNWIAQKAPTGKTQIKSHLQM